MLSERSGDTGLPKLQLPLDYNIRSNGKSNLTAIDTQIQTYRVNLRQSANIEFNIIILKYISKFER